MAATDTLQEMLFAYYVAHQDELLQQYENKYLVLKDESVVGAYDDAASAVHFSRRSYRPGSYIIQLCTRGNSAYTVPACSRIIL